MGWVTVLLDPMIQTIGWLSSETAQALSFQVCFRTIPGIYNEQGLDSSLIYEYSPVHVVSLRTVSFLDEKIRSLESLNGPREATHYCTCYGRCFRSTLYTSHTSTSTEPKRGRSGLNSMTLTVVLLLSSPPRYPPFDLFKQFIAQSFKSFTFSLDRFSCSLECMWRARAPLWHRHGRPCAREGECTIWSVLKSGSALHTITSCSTAERALPTGSGRIPAPVV